MAQPEVARMPGTGAPQAPGDRAETGLSSAQGARRLERDGPNALPQRPPVRIYQRLISQLRDPLILGLDTSTADPPLPTASAAAARRQAAASRPFGRSVTHFAVVGGPVTLTPPGLSCGVSPSHTPSGAARAGTPCDGPIADHVKRFGTRRYLRVDPHSRHERRGPFRHSGCRHAALVHAPRARRSSGECRGDTQFVEEGRLECGGAWRSPPTTARPASPVPNSSWLK